MEEENKFGAYRTEKGSVGHTSFQADKKGDEIAPVNVNRTTILTPSPSIISKPLEGPWTGDSLAVMAWMP